MVHLMIVSTQESKAWKIVWFKNIGMVKQLVNSQSTIDKPYMKKEKQMIFENHRVSQEEWHFTIIREKFWQLLTQILSSYKCLTDLPNWLKSPKKLSVILISYQAQKMKLSLKKNQRKSNHKPNKVLAKQSSRRKKLSQRLFNRTPIKKCGPIKPPNQKCRPAKPPDKSDVNLQVMSWRMKIVCAALNWHNRYSDITGYHPKT